MGFVLPATNRLLLPGNPGFLLPKDVAVPQGLVMYLPMGGDSTIGSATYDISQLSADNRATLSVLGTGPSAIPCDAPTGQGILTRYTNSTNGAYIAFPKANLPYGNINRTLLMWIYNTDNTAAKVVMEYGIFATGRFQWTLTATSAFQSILVQNGSSQFTDNVSIPLNRWTHVAIRSTNGQLTGIRFFVNGLITTATSPNTASLSTTSGGVADAHFIAGDNPDGSGVPQQVYGPQRQCDARIYNRALSDGEIKEIYQSGLRGLRYSNSGFNEMSILPVAGSAVKFRRTLSQLGTRVGSRQAA